MDSIIKGISFLNPVRVEEGYMKHCAKYAIEHGIRHFELIGPTHDPVRGNCDGMMLYRKYAQFNEGKDVEYIKYCEKVVNEALDMVAAHGIKSYYWHHELEVPLGFDEQYPEIHNADGDVEVTHPRIKDFLENKIEDFFYTYPNMTGIVLTLHETRIPLLKLKNQKLDKVERVKYVTEILFNTCKRLGKELIVRPFASIAKDYDDLMNAYEQISGDLLVCDKWTKYDWSLFRPSNPFFQRIKNPLIVETDIFGEYFGKGFLPLMLKKHITEKVKYCSGFGVRGYVSRIDRNGYIPFGTPNEVNLEIMNAAVDGADVDAAIDAFFAREYGEYGPIVKEAMTDTEELQVKALHAEGKTLHWLSQFPPLFGMKTAYTIFRKDCKLSPEQIADGLRFLRPEVVLRDKDEAIAKLEEKLAPYISKEDAKQIRAEVAKNEGKFGPPIEFTGNGTLRFLECYSGRKFTSTLENVLNGEKRLNRNLREGMASCMNDLYHFWNISESEFGDQFGWVPSDDPSIYTYCDPVMFQHEMVEDDDGEPLCLIEIYDYPQEGWMELCC